MLLPLVAFYVVLSMMLPKLSVMSERKLAASAVRHALDATGDAASAVTASLKELAWYHKHTRIMGDQAAQHATSPSFTAGLELLKLCKERGVSVPESPADDPVLRELLANAAGASSPNPASRSVGT